MDPNKSTIYRSLTQMSYDARHYHGGLQVDTSRNNGPFSYDHTCNYYAIKCRYLDMLPVYDRKDGGCYQWSEKLTR
jgi:hypothetical protein